MVHTGKNTRMANRVVVESAVSSDRHAGATVLHRLLPHGESTLAAELHRREQGISSDARGRIYRGARAARVAGRPRDGTADGTDVSGVSQPRDAEPVAPFRTLADPARQVRHDCRR